MTLPTSYSWGAVGARLAVAYEAPQGRRVNALGASFTHGPLSGTFCFESFATLPQSKSQRGRSLAEQAAAHGLAEEEVGRLNSERFVSFLWRVAGRPEGAASDWQRERPLTVVLDNYSVHKSLRVKEEKETLSRAGIELFYLPAYSPELSRMEPLWQEVKYRELPKRTYTRAGELKRAVDGALARRTGGHGSLVREAAQSLSRSA